jgi:hypothetical protein
MLFGLLYSLYLLTYSGVFNSDDERFIFDTTESIVERGTLYLNQTTYIRPFRTSGVEPAQPFLATPLYLIADQLGFVGNVQTTFLFNPLVTALTAVVLFYFALDLGYEKREALLAGLLFGVATIAWPYTKTFFREPLASLSLLACLFFLHRWRQGFEDAHKKRQSFVWLTAGAVAFTISVFTKEAALIAAPVIVIYALPTFKILREDRRSLLFLAAGVLGVVVLLLVGLAFLYSMQAVVGRYQISQQLYWLREEPQKMGPGIAGFLVSPGKSVFVYSPVVLLAVVSVFVGKPEHRRERWLALGMLLTFVVIYAAVQGAEWYGGTGWGPRYLVPVTPLLILGGLSAVNRGLESERLWPKLGLALLTLLSILVQLPGLLINLHDYYIDLYRFGRGAAWTIGVWQVKHSQILGHFRLIPHRTLDLAWVRPSTDWLAIGVLIGGAIIFAGLMLWLAMRSRTKRGMTLALSGGLLLTVSLSGFALHRAYDDPYFNGDVPALYELLAFLDEAASPDDPILLSNPAYTNFFANYYKGDSVWYTMPRSPGERHSEEEVPTVVSDDPEDLVSQEAVNLLIFLTQNSTLHNPAWLVVDGGPFTPWNPRPPEWWAAEHLYTVYTQEFAPTIRLVEYLSFGAPGPDDSPAYEHDYRLGEDIVLAGHDINGLYRLDATAFHPGDQLGLSLVWRSNTIPAEDYVAAVFVANSDGQVILQQDRTPVATFRPTTTWQPGEMIRDNYGFVLPGDMPLGHYEIWVAMYRWPSLERLPVTSTGGEDLGNHLVLIDFDVVDHTVPLPCEPNLACQ